MIIFGYRRRPAPSASTDGRFNPSHDAKYCLIKDFVDIGSEFDDSFIFHLNI